MFEIINPINKSTAWLEIFLLMLGAFLIGYFFARWYYKNKLKNALNEFEEEKRQLKLEIYENSDFSNLSSIKAVKTRNRKGELIQSTDTTIEINEDLNGPSLNFESIGTASEANKDDLKKISGIGPFIEKKLNNIGIYTFDQISKLNKQDIVDVTELIKFFPGRIERDKWVDQASKLKN